MNIQNPPVISTHGVWVPVDASGAALVFTAVSCFYTLTGNICFIYGAWTYPATGSGANAAISGLPFAAAATPLSPVGIATLATPTFIMPTGGTTGATLIETPTTAKTNATLTGRQLYFSGFYPLT